MSAKLISETAIRTGIVRLTFANLFEARADKKGELKYSTGLIIKKSDEATVTAIKQIMTNACKKKFGKVIPGAFKTLRDGDTDEAALIDPEHPEKGSRPELKGCYWINTSSKTKPTVISRERDEFTKEFAALKPSEIKSGDYVRAQINTFGFDTEGNKGVGFGVTAVQLWEEGEALSANAFNADAFDDEELEGAFQEDCV